MRIESSVRRLGLGAASCFICELAADQLDTDSRSDSIAAPIRVALP